MAPLQAEKADEAVYTYMLAKHVEAFKRAAHFFNVYILVRRGNEKSKQWIGRMNYMPKPLDCKAKTADTDFNGKKYAGLVTDPERVPQAFTGLKKRMEADEAWPDFKKKLYFFDPRDPQKNLSADKAQLHYTVQLDEKHEHYGCVMYKPVFRAQAEYIHADYDLYAIVPADDTRTNQLVRETGFGGADHSRSPHLYNVQYFFKAAGEVKGMENPRPPMIRHGEQETYKTELDDTLDVFWPNGITISTLEGPGPIDDFYRNTLGGRVQVSKDSVLRSVYGNWLQT